MPVITSCASASEWSCNCLIESPALQVNTCLRKYQYMLKASQLAEKLQREGKEVPKTFEGMAAAMGATCDQQVFVQAVAAFLLCQMKTWTI